MRVHMGGLPLAILFVLTLTLNVSRASDHGEGHGAEPKKEEKKNYKPYSMTGIEKCVIPPEHEKITADCGSPEYEAYAQKITAYNECIESYEVKVLLQLRTCFTPKPKKEPSVKHLLDPP